MQVAVQMSLSPEIGSTALSHPFSTLTSHFLNQIQVKFKGRENVNKMKTKLSHLLEFTNDALGANSIELVLL